MTEHMRDRIASGRVAAIEDISDAGRQLAVAAGGIVASVGVVLLNAWLIRAIDLDVLGTTGALIIPIGAIGGGFVAAGGYYVAARATHTMPSPQIAWSMVLIAIGTYLLHRWLGYITTMLENGTPARDAMGFWQFVQYSAEHTRVILQSRMNGSGQDIGEIGRLGYVREVLQIVGFSVGGLLVYSRLKATEQCGYCRRYATATRVVKRVSFVHFLNGLEHARILLPELGDQLRKVVGGGPLAAMSMSVVTCTTCDKHWLRPIAIVGMGRSEGERALARFAIDKDGAERVRHMSPVYRSQE